MTAAESRRAQGLSEKVEDPAVLARIAAIVAAATAEPERKAGAG